MTTSGVTPASVVGEPGAGAADAGLHLVEPQQRAVAGRDLAGRGAGSPSGGTTTPASPWIGSSDDRGGLVVDRRGERVGVAVRDEGDVAGQRLERLAVGGLAGERQRAHGAAVEGALGGDQPGAPGAPGQLEGGLVGLGAGVGEEHPAVPAPSSAEQPLGELDLRAAGEEVGDVAEGAQLAR